MNFIEMINQDRQCRPKLPKGYMFHFPKDWLIDMDSLGNSDKARMINAEWEAEEEKIEISECKIVEAAVEILEYYDDLGINKDQCFKNHPVGKRFLRKLGFRGE